MAVGERIKIIRNLRGMTQKYLGMSVCFDEKTADIRMAQYESGKRTPKDKLIAKIAYALEVEPWALEVPDIDTDYGLIHTLFAIEDKFGLKTCKLDGTTYLTIDKEHKKFLWMLGFINKWSREAEKLRSGEITKEEYDDWRYSYPRIEAQRTKERLNALREKEKAESNE